MPRIAEAIRLNPQKYGPAARTDPNLDRLCKNKRFQAPLGSLDVRAGEGGIDA
ncbi:MAG: hypothetical protein ACUVRV_05710 [Cyanobacteriota bacterium]